MWPPMDLGNRGVFIELKNASSYSYAEFIPKRRN